VPPAESVDLVGRPVLFVEDEPEMVMAYKSYLKNSGFQVFSASTTREAMKLLESIEPCAIVLDIVLRSEDTWAFMAWLKNEERTKDIPVIVASTIEDQAKGFHLGADSYVVKPVERADLLRELNALTAARTFLRVLIIDDNELDRYLLKRHLKNVQVAIKEESGGAAGVGAAAGNPPDVIFLDLTMPDMTGYEVVDQLKARQETRDIPVVIVTSRALSDAERRRLSERCAGIINKNSLNESSGGEMIRRTLEDVTRKTK